MEATTTRLPFGNAQDKIYFDVEILPQSNSTVTPITYSQQFNQSIVDDPEKYYAAITKFDIPTANIPSLAVKFVSPSVTTTIYTVTLTYGATTSQQSVIFVPTSGVATTDDTYPFVYAYEDFLIMVNTALATAFTAITPPMGAVAPYFQFDPATSLISLVAQTAYYDRTLMSPINIYCNLPLKVLLDGFPGKLSPFGPAPDAAGRDFHFTVANLGNNFYNVSSVPPAYPPANYIMMQNYPSLSAWSPFSAIRIKTNMIPVKPELVIPASGTVVLGSNAVLQTFFPQFPENQSHSTRIFYVANTYHLINMTGHSP